MSVRGVKESKITRERERINVRFIFGDAEIFPRRKGRETLTFPTQRYGASKAVLEKNSIGLR